MQNNQILMNSKFNINISVVHRVIVRAIYICSPIHETILESNFDEWLSYDCLLIESVGERSLKPFNEPSNHPSFH